jgi:hypothetical protein
MGLDGSSHRTEPVEIEHRLNLDDRTRDIMSAGSII